MTSHPARSAILIALAGFAMLSVGDAVVKTMAGAWPGSAVAALRYTMGLGWMSVVLGVWKGRSAFSVPRPGLQFGRGISVAVSTLCFFMAVMAMPLADATTILFTSPMITLLLSGLILGERVGRSAWGATLLAFAGVLVVLRPNVMALGWTGLWPVGAALGMAGLMLCNRKAAGLAGVLEMQLILTMFAAPMLVVAAVVGHLSGMPQFRVPVPDASVVIKCAIVSVTATLGHLLIFIATTRASAAVVAPMTYVQLLVAGLLGWMLFGDAPDAGTLAGASLVVLAGLWLWRAQQPREVAETPD